MIVRLRVWLLSGSIALALLFGFLGRGTDVEAFDILAGLLWMAAIGLGISLLPFWRRVLPPVPAMPGLFDSVPDQGRWCIACGNSTPKGIQCSICGADDPAASKT